MGYPKNPLYEHLRVIEQNGGAKFSTTKNWVAQERYASLTKPYRYNDVLARTQEIQRSKRPHKKSDPLTTPIADHTEQTTSLETLPIEKMIRLILDITKIINELDAEAPRQRKKWYQFWK